MMIIASNNIKKCDYQLNTGNKTITYPLNIIFMWSICSYVRYMSLFDVKFLQKCKYVHRIKMFI